MVIMSAGQFAIMISAVGLRFRVSIDVRIRTELERIYEPKTLEFSMVAMAGRRCSRGVGGNRGMGRIASLAGREGNWNRSALM